MPRPPRGSKRAEGYDPTGKPTRREQMTRDGLPVEMPPNPAPHIIDRLIEIGLTEAAGMGAVPIGWATIESWGRQTGVTLAPWEVRLLRRLSGDYLTMSRAADDDTCPAPWRSSTVSEAAIRAEQRALDDILG